jgi:enoyl-CoA hydratase/carnithine racemase
VTIDNAAKRNAFDLALLTEFVDTVTAQANRADCTVIVVRAVGPHFCAGWDVTDFDRLRRAGARQVAAELRHTAELLDGLWAVPAVTVAAVRGSVAGFGVGLLARMHLAVASTTTSVMLPEARFGIAAGGVLVDVAALMPAKVALDLLLSAAPIGAEAAQRVGLVSRVVPDDRLDEEAEALARTIAKHPGDAVATMLETFRRAQGLCRAAAVEAAAEAAARTIAEMGTPSKEAS